LALAVFAVPASATHSPGTGPSKDFVTGEAKGILATPFGPAPSQSHINASCDQPVGCPVATGSFWTVIDFTTPSTPFANAIGVATLRGDVICLSVTPPVSGEGGDAKNQAIVQEATATGVIPPGIITPGVTRVLGRNIDNGEPGSTNANSAAPDRNGGIIAPALPPTFCQLPIATLPVDQGNWIVHKAL
jgi:hypothetical protein